MEMPIKKPNLQAPSLGIFWDTISCPIPESVNPGDVLDNVIAALRVHFPDNYVLESFFVYGVPSYFEAHPLRPREGAGVKIRVVDGAYNLYKQINTDVFSFANGQIRRHAGMVVISTISDLHGMFYLFHLCGCRASIVVPLSDPTTRICLIKPNFLLLDWLCISRGSGKIITKDDIIYISAAAPVAGNAVADEGSTRSVCSSGSNGQIQGVCLNAPPC